LILFFKEFFMIFSHRKIFFILSAVLSFGCSSHSQIGDSLNSNASATSSGALPKSWYNVKSEDAVVAPDPKTDDAVDSAFQANVSALLQSEAQSETQANAQSAASAARTPWLLSTKNSSSHPADWVPWHLDGMVGYYAVSQSGILGALLYSGTESIKLTWQKPSSSTPAPSAVAQIQKAPALKVTPDLKEEDLPSALEPSIQVALASGSIQNESNFRKNILDRAEKFFNICRALDTITRTSGWYVDGYQLNLNVSASGQVTPVVGVGSAVNLYFDWSRTSDPTIAPAPVAPSSQLKNFVQLVSSAIPQAVKDSSDVQKSGFYLDMVQVGLGITAGGDIGVAQVQGGDIGRIIFKRDVTVIDTAGASAAIDADSDQQLNVIQAETASAPASVVYKVSSRKFKNGLKHAIKMANYFAARAKKAENSKYKLNQIESEFDIALTGDLKLAVVNGIGQFVLDFDLIQ
jgi:hypothetical protein